MAEKVIAVIGAGGKTTALGILARQGIARGNRSVLVTTTTHIRPMESGACRVYLTDPTPEELTKELLCPGIVCAGNSAGEGKLGILSGEALAFGLETVGLTIYEGDGAHCRPLKLHRCDEPVILRETGRCLVVAGLSAMGRPVSESVHRHHLCRAWEEASMCPVGPEELLYCVMETAEASGLPQEDIRVFLNQADVLSDSRPAERAAETLCARGLDTRWGSLQKESGFLLDWVLK